MVQNGSIQVLYLQVAWIKPQQIYSHYRVGLDHAALDPTAVLVHNAPTAKNGAHSVILKTKTEIKVFKR